MSGGLRDAREIYQRLAGYISTHFETALKKYKFDRQDEGTTVFHSSEIGASLLFDYDSQRNEFFGMVTHGSSSKRFDLHKERSQLLSHLESLRNNRKYIPRMVPGPYGPRSI